MGENFAKIGIRPTRDGLVLFVVGRSEMGMIPYSGVPEFVAGVVGALSLPYLSAEQAKIMMHEIWGTSNDE